MPADQPLFTVVMPAYNAARFIGAAIGSVRNQTCQDWELIVVNDGSRDRTEAIARACCERDARMRLITVPNQGVSAARNHALALARGRYIAFLDADDLWHGDMLARHARHFAEKPEVGVSFTRARYMTHDGMPTRTVSTAPVLGLTSSDLLYENPTTTPSTVAVRRELVEAAGGFDEAMSGTEDLEWLFRVVHTTRYGIEGIDEVLALYRTGGAGASANLDRMAAGWEQYMARVRRLDGDLCALHYRPARANQLRYLARQALRHGSSAKAFSYINQALACDWRLLVRSPRRTLLTLAAAYLRRAAALLAPQLAQPQN